MKQEDEVKTELPIYHRQTHRQTHSVVWTFMLIVEVLIYGSFSILVNLSKVDGKLPFNTSTVVLLIETSKLLCSMVMYLPELMHRSFRIPRLPALTCASFSIPAVLYMLNNNLGLLMQTQMDPTTYQVILFTAGNIISTVLSNLKIATTGLLYRIIIKRKLTKYQWLALGLLMLAGVCDSYAGFHSNVPNTERIFITARGLAMMLTYTFVSGLAAVYTEYILKNQFKMSLHIQNMLLYTYGVTFNLLSSWWNTDMSHDQSHGFLSGFTFYTWIIVITQASNGLIMSVIMKHGSNITRLFIISSAMLVSTLLSMFVLGMAINLTFIFAAVLVIIAIYLYNL